MGIGLKLKEIDSFRGAGSDRWNSYTEFIFFLVLISFEVRRWHVLQIVGSISLIPIQKFVRSKWKLLEGVNGYRWNVRTHVWILSNSVSFVPVRVTRVIMRFIPLWNVTVFRWKEENTRRDVNAIIEEIMVLRMKISKLNLRSAVSGYFVSSDLNEWKLRVVRRRKYKFYVYGMISWFSARQMANIDKFHTLRLTERHSWPHLAITGSLCMTRPDKSLVSDLSTRFLHCQKNSLFHHC